MKITKLKKKDEIVEAIARDETVQLKWGPVGIDIIDVEHSNELLCKIVEMWVSVHGFAITSNWMCLLLSHLKSSSSTHDDIANS
jgi:hypothetical protein